MAAWISQTNLFLDDQIKKLYGWNLPFLGWPCRGDSSFYLCNSLPICVSQFHLQRLNMCERCSDLFSWHQASVLGLLVHYEAFILSKMPTSVVCSNSLQTKLIDGLLYRPWFSSCPHLSGASGATNITDRAVCWIKLLQWFKYRENSESWQVSLFQCLIWHLRSNLPAHTGSDPSFLDWRCTYLNSAKQAIGTVTPK